MIDRLNGNGPLVVAAHRGFKAEYPENTLLAFKEAMALGVDMIEFDLRLTRDGELVVIHDATVDRTTDGEGLVRSYTLKELKRFDAGGWFAPSFRGLQIPTLEELCELLSGYPNVLLNVEIKKDVTARQAADDAVAALARHGYIDRCVFTSFDANIVAHIRDRHGLRTQGFPQRMMSNFVIGDGGTYSKMWSAAVGMNELTAEQVREIKAFGLHAWCWSPDTYDQVAYAAECGVVLVTCDDPRPALRYRTST
ncbi:glycerophosphodiester phosphodiesterase [Paenibacillus sp. TRM 82003]|nr:glycerophosphodiester phosphodiesterase [Paenibacillus sp. TRM 82003]